MKKRIYQLCGVMLLVAFASPALCQVTTTTVSIQDGWKKTTATTFHPDGEIETAKYTNARIGESRVELKIIGRNRYKSDEEYEDRGFVGGRRSFAGHWSGTYIGLTNYLSGGNIYGSNGEFMRLDWSGSKAVSLNPFQADISLSRNGSFGMVVGAGFEYQRLRFSDEHTTIGQGERGVVVPLAINSEYDVRRSVFKHIYLTFPILFECQSGGAFVSAGVIGGIRLHSKTKVVYDYQGHKNKAKNTDDFSMIPFKVDATVRVGYGSVALFCNYTLTPMFENNKGPELFPLTIGIGFGL